ncbi:MAG TPA: D-cysteine desulfhydrase family protein [Thermomicrobiales bacterium]|nr:D-cysteine desulfhydrase family protein [Thermomicrobiales bacterium]
MTTTTQQLHAHELRDRLDRVPRFPLAAKPTPLEAQPRLSAALGGPEILVKRDDLTGLVFGGNKVRELEYFIGDALAKGADVFIAGGGVGQSNHARQCAAAAIRAGIKPVLVLREGPTGQEPTGNLLITHLLGAEIHWTADDPEIKDRGAMAARMDAVAEDYRQRGQTPYVLYSSVHPLGALGYVECALELAEQLGEANGRPVKIYTTSMGVTWVGIALGLAALGISWPVIGVGWRPVFEGLPQQLAALADGTAALLGIDNPFGPDDFKTLDFGGPVYGVPSAEALEAMVLCARTDALLVDPSYTAKGMAGMISQIREGVIGPAETVVFVHTGGLPALFAYGEDVLAASGISPRP